MSMRGPKSLAAVAVLTCTGWLLSTPLASGALVFMREFERSGRGSVQVSLQERVVYSLLEARDSLHTPANCRTTAL